VLAFIGFIFWFLFNVWLSLASLAIVLAPISVGGRDVYLSEALAFIVSTSLCVFSWYNLVASVSIKFN
jgi:hypothetical protein